MTDSDVSKTDPSKPGGNEEACIQDLGLGSELVFALNSVTLGIAENGKSIFLCCVLMAESLPSFSTLQTGTFAFVI